MGARLKALDGLRGVAALVVLLCHVAEAGVPAIGTTQALGGDPGGLAHWFLRTPLAIVWAGQQFVIVFFVLSGLVLTRALLAPGAPPPLAFYAGRVVRLYLPAWLSLIPAALLLALVPRALGHGFWLDAYARPTGLEQVARDLALVLPDRIRDVGGTLNRPLWSLRWEILFSLALPALLALPGAAGVLRRGSVAIGAAAVLAVAVGGGAPAASFMAPFALGMALAGGEGRIALLRARLRGRGAVVAMLGAACLLTADRWLPETAPVGAGAALVTAGAGLAVLCPLLYGSIDRALRARPAAWLGSRSFSLYLTHFPIVLALAFGLGRPGLPTLAATAIPLSLLAAELFHRAVERPCHRLARRATADVGKDDEGGATTRRPRQGATQLGRGSRSLVRPPKRARS